MANNISKRPRTAFLSQRLFLRPDGRLSVFSERARPEILRCGHSSLRHSPAFVFEAETAASFAANDFLPRRRHFLPRRRRCRVFDRVDAALRPRLLFSQRSRAFPFACLPYVSLSDVWPALLRTAPPHGALPQHIARIAAIEPARNPDERRSFALHAERLRQRHVHVCVDEQNALRRRAGTHATSRANVDLPGDPCLRRRPAFPGPLPSLRSSASAPTTSVAFSPAGGIPASPAIASMRLRPQATTSPGKARSGRHIPASRAEIGIPGTVDMHYNNITSVEMFGELGSPFAEHRDRTDAGFRGGHDVRTVGASPRNADDGIGFRKDAGDFGLQRAAKTQKQTHRRLPAKTYPSFDRMAENLTHALVRHLDFGRRPPPRRSSPPR